ncbi:MAG: methyltransferase [Bryobacteraceae bacterium]
MHAPELPPSAQLMNLIWGKTISAAISGIAKLGVADHMPDGEPVSAEALAAASGAHAHSLYRVMRMLAGLGVFQEFPGQRFALTPVGRCLRSDAADSMRGVAMYFTDSWHMRGYEHMVHSLRTGESGIQKAYGRNAFEVMSDNVSDLENFQAGMSNFSAQEGPLLDPLLDFAGFRRIADIGGGHGALVARILHRNPHLQGVLFDLPAVIAHAPSAASLGCDGRLTLESGSMFERVPAGCDAYIMKHIIHDWSDAHCHAILRLVCDQLARNAAGTGRVFLAEMVVPHTPEPHPAKFLDIEMLSMTPGGCERTESEFKVMFEGAGLEMVGVKTTAGPICLIEGRVAR